MRSFQRSISSSSSYCGTAQCRSFSRPSLSWGYRLIYRWYFRAHSVRGLERSVLRFAGTAPVRETSLGMVNAASDAKWQGWFDRTGDYAKRLI